MIIDWIDRLAHPSQSLSLKWAACSQNSLFPDQGGEQGWLGLLTFEVGEDRMRQPLVVPESRGRGGPWTCGRRGVVVFAFPACQVLTAESLRWCPLLAPSACGKAAISPSLPSPCLLHPQPCALLDPWQWGGTGWGSGLSHCWILVKRYPFIIQVPRRDRRVETPRCSLFTPAPLCPGSSRPRQGQPLWLHVCCLRFPTHLFPKGPEPLGTPAPPTPALPLCEGTAGLMLPCSQASPLASQNPTGCLGKSSASPASTVDFMN